MIRGSTEDVGEFRSRPINVIDGEGRAFRVGLLPAYVPQLVTELLEWVDMM